MTNDDDCGCGKQVQKHVPRPAHAHGHDLTTARGLSPDDLHQRLEGRGWKADAITMSSEDGRRTVTVWRRSGIPGTLTHNDTLVTLALENQVQLFRLSEVRPLEMVLSGKAPPA